MKLGIYQRVSTAKQAKDDKTSLASQETANRAKAAALGANIAWIGSEDISGTIHPDARPLAAQAIAMLETGKLDGLICYDVTRLSRESEHALNLWNRLNVPVVRTHFATESYSPEDKFMFTIKAGYSDEERRKLAARAATGRQGQALQGRQPIRTRTPWGYHLIQGADIVRGEFPPGTEGTYVIDEDVRPIIEQLFARAANGHTLRSLGKWIEDQGIACTSGGAIWYASTVRNILQNTIYMGQAKYKRTTTTQDKKRIGKEYRGKTLTTARVTTFDESKAITIPAPAIITADLWEAANAQIQQNKEDYSGKNNLKYPLTGILRCPGCGRKMVGASDKRVKCKVYTCGYNRANPCPDRHQYKAHEMEIATAESLMALTEMSPDLQAAITRTLAEPQPDAADLAARDRTHLQKIMDKQKAAVRLQVQAAAMDEDTTPYDELLAELSKEKQKLQLRIANSEAQPASTAELAGYADQVSKSALAAGGLILNDAIPGAEKRRMLLGFIDKIIPNRDSHRPAVDIYLKPPSTVQYVQVNYIQVLYGDMS